MLVSPPKAAFVGLGRSGHGKRVHCEPGFFSLTEHSTAQAPSAIVLVAAEKTRPWVLGCQSRRIQNFNVEWCVNVDMDVVGVERSRIQP